MGYMDMNKQYENDLKGFECKLKAYVKKRKIKLVVLSMAIGFYIGISLGLYLPDSNYIGNLTLTINAIIISMFIGAASWVFAWDAQKRNDMGMEYNELRFNYVMQFLKIIDDRISLLNKLKK